MLETFAVISVLTLCGSVGIFIKRIRHFRFNVDVDFDNNQKLPPKQLEE